MLVPFAKVRRSEDWRRWERLAVDAPPFLSPDFFSLITPLVDRDGAPVVAAARAQDALAGVLPLLQRGKTLRALRCDHSPSFDYCGSAEGLAEIWRGLRRDGRWDELVLGKVPADSLLAARLPALAREDGCPVTVRPDARHPYFALAGFEARMSPKFLSNLRRCARRAGDLTLERLPVPAPADLDEATAIEAMAWKGEAGTSIAADGRVERLYRALLGHMGRRGRAALYFLRAAGQRIATLLSVEDRRTLFALKIGYDPRHAALSPGHLLVWRVAAEAERRGLAELDFVGREDGWKAKWTDQVHEHVAVVVYRRSLRGLARWALREEVKPRLPRDLRQSWRSPLPRTCQRADLIGPHGPLGRLRDRVRHGLGLRSGLRRGLRRLRQGPAPAATAPALGAPSRFAPGTWVRVLDADRVRATLDAAGKLRGLAFVPSQWAACGGVFRVRGAVQRLRDDRGRYRAVARTVLLEGVHCGGAAGPSDEVGCGRDCPLMFRDEWLEEAPAPRRAPPSASTARGARVRDADEIARGLDPWGRRDGLTFMPEMAAHAGRRFPIAREVTRVFEDDRWMAPAARVFLLEGLHCTGAIAGAKGPCHRACALMWHEDWLVLEPERPGQVQLRVLDGEAAGPAPATPGPAPDAPASAPEVSPASAPAPAEPRDARDGGDLGGEA